MAIERQNPTSELTNADLVTWRVTIDQPVAPASVDSADFQPALLSGSLAGASVTGVVQVDSVTVDVTVDTGSGDGELHMTLRSNQCSLGKTALDPMCITEIL